MSISYHVYANDGSGGPVDYSTPVATVTGLTYTPAAIPFSSDVTYAVRAYDTATGLEEQNVSARFRLRTGPAGEDLTGLPAAPVGLRARPGVSGSVSVTWAALPRAAGLPLPTGFRVYRGTPAVVLTAGSHVATVPYARGVVHYSATVAGLTGGTAYQFAVRAYNAAGVEQNAAVSTATPASAGPAAVSSGGVEVVDSDLAPAGFPPLPPS
jgi:hypothetical protein